MKLNGLDSWNSWIVAAASSLIFLLISWPMRLGAQLFVSIIDRYDTNRKEASFPFALASLMRSLSGPFAGFFGGIFGLEGVTLLGCLFCTIGVGGCFFAEDIVTVDICLGLVYGIGFGWSTCLVPEILNRNFKKHRNKAYGLFFGGSGLGAFVSPPILDVILNKYGVSGTFLMMCGIIFNSVAAAMLVTTPKLARKHAQKPTAVKSEANNTNLDGENVIALNFNSVDIPSAKTSANNAQLTSNEKHCSEPLTFKYSNAESTNLNEAQVVITKYNSISDAELHLKGAQSSNTDQNNVSTIRTLFRTIDILWHPLFLLISFLQSANMYANYLFWTITVDLVRDKGIEQHLEVYFVMCLSLFDTIGRFFLGSLIDCGILSVAGFCSACYAVTSLSCCLLTLLSDFWSTMAVICVLGLVFGGNTASLPGIVTEFIDIDEKRAVAMSSRIIVYAPLSFTISPLIGYFREDMGSYNGLLYVLAIACLISAVLTLILPKLANNKWCRQR